MIFCIFLIVYNNVVILNMVKFIAVLSNYKKYFVLNAENLENMQEKVPLITYKDNSC